MIGYVLILFCFIQFILHENAISQENTLIPFSLEDQFGNEYTHHDFDQHVTIIVGSDKEGSQFNEKWSFAIFDSLKSILREKDVRFLPIANVKGVPFFLKGTVKGKFPQEKEKWILLDWRGKFSEEYHFKDESCNIVIVNRRGNVVYRTSGRELDQKKLSRIFSELKNLFNNHELKSSFR